MACINTKKSPKSALSFYIELYCKRKKMSKEVDKEIILQATKSWTTLSEEEKSQFVNKFNECKRKQRDKLANYLKRIQPYMKKKQTCKRNSDSYQNEDLINKSDESCNIGIDNFSQSTIKCETVHNIAGEQISDSLNNVPEISNSNVSVCGVTHAEPVLIEPVPPNEFKRTL
ncbi:uncharacterized protein LOC113518451 isoform X2 [Galleria mellonella]|uniref:Uncharacterized protein LOC113518451 isoform X2 n=1 Tax=Galleria mellonella TaxID=7137 RepID=A0ABM3N687_GALME|nr:uncharacterized protein LOC113518451 isoform X2 [Galleria mellonella]